MNKPGEFSALMELIFGEQNKQYFLIVICLRSKGKGKEGHAFHKMTGDNPIPYIGIMSRRMRSQPWKNFPGRGESVHKGLVKAFLVGRRVG